MIFNELLKKNQKCWNTLYVTAITNEHIQLPNTIMDLLKRLQNWGTYKNTVLELKYISQNDEKISRHISYILLLATVLRLS